ncbi:MAG: deoxyribodipyrimidine photolyase [Cyclobacteriaceae bacterium]|nr:deoxyribodipyrimidine photolyase [Cyclobacteriaceae bacterium]
MSDIKQKIDRIDPIAYGKTRNYLSGAVSRLSAYISRGVISPIYVAKHILQRYSPDQARPFLYQLAWREYFQKIWYRHGNKIFTDWYHVQQAERSGISNAVLQAATGIEVLDNAIVSLYTTGYMHNHVRMYVASLLCNIGRYHWLMPARWMYYHLLDGDLASNMLSWQWIAGTFSHKKYYFNQDNVNHYCNSHQRGTFLDKSYGEISEMPCPELLKESSLLPLKNNLPNSSTLQLDYSRPLLLYTSYHLNPNWHADEEANRVLVLEPGHFENFPISENVLNFIIQTAKAISGLQIFCGEVPNIPDIKRFKKIISIEHPLTRHFPGIKEEPEWLFPGVYPKGSFSSFWKLCQPLLSTLKTS